VANNPERRCHAHRAHGVKASRAASRGLEGGVVMHRRVVSSWSLDGSDLGVDLLGGASLPAGAGRVTTASPGRPGHQLHPPDLGLYERRICANSDGDDVVVPSRMTESGLPQ
jgi:hypothetical protein